MTDAENTTANAKHIAFELEIDAEQGIASAVLSKSDQPSSLSSAQILEQINAQGCGNWLINESAIEDVVHKFNKAITSKVVVAELKNASFLLTLSDDAMTAAMRVTPAKGGQPLSIEGLKQTLSEKRVDPKRIIAAALDKAVTTDNEIEIAVAKGKPPQTGRDSFFSPLLFHSEDEAPVEDEQGNVDFYAGRTYLTIEAGTPLMERIPPQPGQVGIDIFGQIIPAEPGKEIPFAKELEGTEFASNDPNLLVAKISGHPVFFSDGARVDETLQFKNINVTTGHIKFDGSIHVDGDVMADMSIDVTGDVFVKGVVERADIKAGNDIHVGGGILGNTATVVDEEGTLPPLECVLEAGGSITARYVNLANVKAQGDIEVKEYAFNSYLKAHACISLGQNGGKGNLVGGEAYAGHEVHVKALGNKAYNQTIVRVGVTREELAESQKLKFLRDQRIKQARNLRTILDELKSQDTADKLGEVEINKAKKVHETLKQLQVDVKAIDQRLREFEFATIKKTEPNISVTSKCFPNCFVTINGALHKTNQEHKAITFIKRGRKITAKS